MHGLTAPIQHVHLMGTLWLIPLLPLLGSVANAFFGTRIQARAGKKGVAAIAVGAMGLAFLLAVWHFVTLIGLPEHERFLLNHCWTMIRVGSLDVNFDLAMDPLSALMTLIITGVGTMIHVYASSYMESEPSYWRFFCYLNLFVFAMLLLVLGDNFFIMFFGWEGVGLCSYLLIGFWWKDYNKASAGMKAFVVNRVGDWGFVVGLMLLFWSMGGSWGMSSGMDVEYTRHDPRPAITSQADLRVDQGDDARPTIYPVSIVDEGEGGEVRSGVGDGREGAREASPTDVRLASNDPSQVALGADAIAAANAGGKSYLTMTALPGARVFISGANIETSEPIGVSPFVRLELPATSADLTIDLGRGIRPVMLTGVALPAGKETALTSIGPSVTFRNLRDQFELTDSTHAQFIKTTMAPGDGNTKPGKTVWGISVLTLACICFFVGATGKSAQIPLYVWLPDAMAGPTPVSALIHAATMVTAGVYMIARLSFLFSLSQTACTVIACVGALTALFAATIGFFQMDIKKVLAYSTVSQLGFMFIGVGVGAYWAGVFHLMTHAFFKACLFLGSGSVIHGMHAVEHDEVAAQDMRNMGGLKKVMPKTARTYFIACLAITAAPIPLFAGFWSKDEILWKAFTTERMYPFANGFPIGKLIYIVGLLAAMCTSFYMWRSYYLTFEGKPRKKGVLEKVHESPSAMTSVLWILAGLSAIAGVLFGLSKDFLGLGIGPEHPILEKWLEPVVAEVSWVAEPKSTEITLMALSVGLALISWFVAKKRYGDDRAKDWDAAEAKLPLYTVTQNKYYVDEIYKATVIAFILRLRMVLAGFDTYVVDGFVNFGGLLIRSVAWINAKIDYIFVDGAVRGVSEGLLAIGSRARRLQTGRIQNYVLAALGGVAIFALIAQLLK